MQSNCVRQVVPRYEMMQDRLAHRLLKGDKKTAECRNHQKMPYLDRSEMIHNAEKERQQQERTLGEHKDEFTVCAVDDRAAERGEKRAR